jgi:P-type E1-E2 ATPase
MDEMRLLTPPSLHAQIEQCNSQLPAWVMIGWDGRVRGAFLIDEQIRPEAKSVVADLQHMGFNLLVLSGDGQQRANKFARSIGIPVRGGLLPSDKVAAIDAARRRHSGVAMVGDGLNDAVALAAADVGIALACGCDVSREAADICLLGNDLSRIPWIIRLARKTVKVIRQNLFWAFAYNTIGIAMAVMGTLNPIWAAVAMTFSSFFVVANSLRLGVSSEATTLAQSPDMNNKHIEAIAPMTSEASDFCQWMATDLVKTS